jgi:hypothetical protein
MAIASTEIPAKAPRCRISAMGARAAALRRQRREGETERDSPCPVLKVARS